MKKDSDGNITGTETWKPNSRTKTGWESKKRVDLNKNGKPEFNKSTGQLVNTPHTQGGKIRGGVRPARSWEIP